LHCSKTLLTLHPMGAGNGRYLDKLLNTVTWGR
jgi:hypothetical protein